MTIVNKRAIIQNGKLFVHKKATKNRQAGVIIITKDVKRWIGNSFYDDINTDKL